MSSAAADAATQPLALASEQSKGVIMTCVASPVACADDHSGDRSHPVQDIL